MFLILNVSIVLILLYTLFVDALYVGFDYPVTYGSEFCCFHLLW